MSIFNEYGNVVDKEILAAVDAIYDAAKIMFDKMKARGISVQDMRAVEALAISEIAGAAAYTRLTVQVRMREAERETVRRKLEGIVSERRAIDGASGCVCSGDETKVAGEVAPGQDGLGSAAVS